MAEPDATEGGFYRYLLSTGRSLETARTYVPGLRTFVRWCLAHEVDAATAAPEALHRYIADQMEQHARNTARNRLMALRAFYAYCRAQHIRRDDPTRGLRVRREKTEPRRPLMHSEMLALLDACKRGKFREELSHRDRTMLLVLLDCGLRVSELVAMRRADVDFERGLILIHGKGAKQRWVAPGSETLDALALHVLPSGPVWRTRTGRAINRKRAQEIVRRTATKAGVVGVSPHRLRAHFAMSQLSAGADVIDVQAMMGHEDTSTTALYVRAISTNRALETMRRLSVADRLLAG